MWQFAEVVEGISEACEALGIPVIGGNVSFYNESQGADIHPTPVVGVLGLIDGLDDAPPAARLDVGRRDRRARPDPAGARRLRVGRGDARRDRRDAARRRPRTQRGRCTSSSRELVAAHEVNGVHDVSDGGLAVALSEMAFAGEVGFRVDLASDGCTAAEACFAESASRVVVSVAPAHVVDVLARAGAAGVPAQAIGTAGGDQLVAAERVRRRASRRAPGVARRDAPPDGRCVSATSGVARVPRGGLSWALSSQATTSVARLLGCPARGFDPDLRIERVARTGRRRR